MLESFFLDLVHVSRMKAVTKYTEGSSKPLYNDFLFFFSFEVKKTATISTDPKSQTQDPKPKH